MGASDQESDRLGRESELPRHSVRISTGFWLGETPVTQEQWGLLMEKNPSRYQGPKFPVCGCDWSQAREFCERLGQTHPALGVRLPTEAEWEYACRAETTSAFNDGADLVGFKLDTPALHKLAIYKATSRGEWDAEHTPRDVRSKKPNKWGLYDMHGSVEEWCLDHYSIYSSEPQVDPVVTNSDSSLRIARGGHYLAWAYECRSAMRRAHDADTKLDALGFRIVIADAS